MAIGLTEVESLLNSFPWLLEHHGFELNLLDFLLVIKSIVSNDFIAITSRNLKFSDLKCIRHTNLFLSDYKFSLLLINFRIVLQVRHSVCAPLIRRLARALNFGISIMAALIRPFLGRKGARPEIISFPARRGSDLSDAIAAAAPSPFKA